MTTKHTRRRVLKGMLGGTAVTLALPFLDCFLNERGTALASGEPLPVVFGSWFQALSFNPGRWKPDRVGPGYQNNIELKVLDPFRDRMNVISGSKYFLDGRPLETHVTGVQIATMGSIPVGEQYDPSLDTFISEVIGKRTRFRSIQVTTAGGQDSLSRGRGGAINPSEPSPAALYTRIFGPDYRDPNAARFTPDPRDMARRSVLSALTDERQRVMSSVGAADRARLDAYFTSVRQLERQLDIALTKPARIGTCRKPPELPAQAEPGTMVDEVKKNTQLFGQLMAHAIGCDQTRVFNVDVESKGLRTPGGVRDWHSQTHEEAIDPKLGYQKDVGWFINFANGAFAQFLQELDGYREGAGSVLDRSIVLWQTDHGYARTHTMEDVPILTIGSGAGKIKTGVHIAATGDPSTRIGLTLQQVFGVSMNSWGRLSNKTSNPFTELLV